MLLRVWHSEVAAYLALAGVGQYTLPWQGLVNTLCPGRGWSIHFALAGVGQYTLPWQGLVNTLCPGRGWSIHFALAGVSQYTECLDYT